MSHFAGIGPFIRDLGAGAQRNDHIPHIEVGQLGEQSHERGDCLTGPQPSIQSQGALCTPHRGDENWGCHLGFWPEAVVERVPITWKEPNETRRIFTNQPDYFEMPDGSQHVMVIEEDLYGCSGTEVNA